MVPVDHANANMRWYTMLLYLHLASLFVEPIHFQSYYSNSSCALELEDNLTNLKQIVANYIS